MPKIIYKEISFDSQEEVDFFHWCTEAFESGLIKSFFRCSKKLDSFELIGKQYYTVDKKKKFLFHNVTYCPDFIIHESKILDIYEKPIYKNNIVIDVKPSFSKHGDAKQFSIIRKLMMQIHNIYIHKIIPEELFKKTWLPEKAGRTKVKGNIEKKYIDCKNIKEYMETI